MRGPESPDVVPIWLWRLVLAALVSVVIGGAITALLLAAGVADPPTAGPVRWRQETLDSGCLGLTEITLPALQPPVTISLAASRLETADPFDTWGLWLENPTTGPRWEVLPPGYYRYQAETFPFPHVGEGRNELRLDLADGAFVLWLNRKRAAAGDWVGDPSAWGLIGGEPICWHSLALYGPN